MPKKRRLRRSRKLTAHFPGKNPTVSLFFADNQTQPTKPNRSEQRMETVSVAPPKRLRSQAAAPQLEPLPGTTRQRIENRTHVKTTGDETESNEDETDEDDEDESVTDENDEDHSSNSHGNNGKDDANSSNSNNNGNNGNEEGSKMSGYVAFPSLPFVRDFFSVFRRRRPCHLSRRFFFLYLPFSSLFCLFLQITVLRQRKPLLVRGFFLLLHPTLL